MNNTFKKRIDELGRIVIPKQIRNTFKIKDFDELELYIDNDNIVIKKTGGILLIKDKLDNLLNFFKTYLNIECFIIDKNTIISSNIEEMKNIETINIDPNIYLNNQEYSELKLNSSITLNGIIKSYQLIYDSNLYGHIIFILKDKTIDNSVLNDIVKLIINYVN